jgi:tRNA-dihydrouridine synthase B
MQIGAVAVAEPAVALAPMAGVTDLPFRLLAKEMGCSLLYSEMVSYQGLLHNNCHTWDMLRIDERERPLAMQIFGAEPAGMAAAARIVARAGADIIDINMGCPTPKIVRNGEGCALMRRPELAYEIMAAVAAAVDVPVTVKIRKGWDAASVNAVEIAALAERAGVAAIAVHGRTREQFYAGAADWDIIRSVKERVGIPVIGNGDVRTPQDAARLLAHTGCDAVMVGRAAQGNPWLFRQISEFLQSGQLPLPPSLAERLEVVGRHLAMLIEHKGERVAVREMRRHAAWYTRGLPHAAEIRLRLNQAESRGDFVRILAALGARPEGGDCL